MKPLLTSLALVAALALASANCDSKSDCPYRVGNECLDPDAGSGGVGGQNEGPCDGGTVVLCTDGQRVCSLSACPP